MINILQNIYLHNYFIMSFSKEYSNTVICDAYQKKDNSNLTMDLNQLGLEKTIWAKILHSLQAFAHRVSVALEKVWVSSNK